MNGRRMVRPEEGVFNRALDRAHMGDGPAPMCDGLSEVFVDYRSAPTKDEAREMCEPCPLITLCRASARSVRPDHGVWGGEVWDRGRRLHGPGRRLPKN